MTYYPLKFEPIYCERVWGGRSLESLYGRQLPANTRVGESWELVDRSDYQSIVKNGALRGKSLHDVCQAWGAGLHGNSLTPAGRFSLLLKILDAREVLSVQVHPPASIAPRLGGEPKTEAWYFTATDPGATIFAGFAPGASQSDFEHALQHGGLQKLFYSCAVHPGEVFFIPSGRLHALGAGNVLFEIQQNSDTTYRVYDWDRVGLDGNPRQLHINQSLASIDFEDFSPAPALPVQQQLDNGVIEEVFVNCPEFVLSRWLVPVGDTISVSLPQQRFVIFGGLDHPFHISCDDSAPETIAAGEFVLVAADCQQCQFTTTQPTQVYCVQSSTG